MTFSGNFMPRRFGVGGTKLEVGKVTYSPDYVSQPKRPEPKPQVKKQ